MSMGLREWRLSRVPHLSVGRLARLLGVHPRTVQKYERYQREPGLAVKIALYRLSGGLVTPNDLIELPALTAAERAAAAEERIAA